MNIVNQLKDFVAAYYFKKYYDDSNYHEYMNKISSNMESISQKPEYY